MLLKVVEADKLQPSRLLTVAQRYVQIESGEGQHATSRIGLVVRLGFDRPATRFLAVFCHASVMTCA